MKQKLDFDKKFPINPELLQGLKEDSIKKLNELEQERKDGKIDERIYKIFKRGLQDVIEGKVTRVA